MKNLIFNSQLVLCDRILKDGWLVTSDSIIDDFGFGNPPKGNYDKIVDAKGQYLTPGFIDTHVHGGLKHDFTDATTEQIIDVMRLHFNGGTTSMLPTLTSVTHETYLKAFKNFNSIIDSLNSSDDVPQFEGMHLEGPYSSGAALGAQNTKTYRDPDYSEINQYLEMAPYIKKWTAAPERKGGMEFGRFCEKHGIVASIGHSNATLAQCYEAYNNGYHHITHLYSACSSYHRNGAYREGGIVEAAWLIENMDVEMITDGVHLPKEFLQLIYKIKGPEHICMITDATRYAGVNVPEGAYVPYRDGEESGVWIENGVALVKDKSCFAGSIATYDRLVRTATKIAQIPMVDAIKMATYTPARINGILDRVGSIARGKQANLLIFDDDVKISSIFLRGKKVR